MSLIVKLEILNNQLSEYCLSDPWVDNEVKLAWVGSFSKGGPQLWFRFLQTE